MVKSEAYTNLGNSSSTKADLRVLHAVQDVQGNSPLTTRVLMYEVKCQYDESREPAWSNALKHISACAGTIPAHEKHTDPQPSIFIILCLKAQLQFYEILSDEEEAVD